MPNYYELLKIQPTATLTEIEAAFEVQYNQWRRLVTHHDPNVVEQANRALRDLEQIRTTLTDVTKRAAYDAGIGLSGQIGGLADPAAVLRTAALLSPHQPQAAAKSTESERTDAWVCTKCQHLNSIGTRYCEGCGQIIGIECPNCGKLTKAASIFCASCGVNLEQTRRQKQATLEDQVQRDKEQRFRYLQSNIENEYRLIQQLESLYTQQLAPFSGQPSEIKQAINEASKSAPASAQGTTFLLLVAAFVGTLLLGTIVFGNNNSQEKAGASFAIVFPLAVAVSVLANAWLKQNLLIKPGLPKIINKHREQIAKIEQEIKEIQAENRAS